MKRAAVLRDITITSGASQFAVIQAVAPSLGVEVSPVKHYEKDGSLSEGRGERWNSFVFFSDLDGNGWILQEQG